MWMSEGALGGYPGYLVGAGGNDAMMVFFQGLLLHDAESGGAPGPERLVDEGSSVPTATWHKQGDIHFLTGAQPGYYAAMVNTADGANFKPFGAVMLDPPTGVTGDAERRSDMLRMAGRHSLSYSARGRALHKSGSPGTRPMEPAAGDATPIIRVMVLPHAQ